MRLGVYILMNNTMDILSANNLSKYYSKNKGLFKKQSINLRAVNNININLKAKLFVSSFNVFQSSLNLFIKYILSVLFQKMRLT